MGDSAASPRAGRSMESWRLLGRDQVKMLFVTKVDVGTTGGVLVVTLLGGVVILGIIAAILVSSL